MMSQQGKQNQYKFMLIVKVKKGDIERSLKELKNKN